jgi:hypothetical protein
LIFVAVVKVTTGMRDNGGILVASVEYGRRHNMRGERWFDRGEILGRLKVVGDGKITNYERDLVAQLEELQEAIGNADAHAHLYGVVIPGKDWRHIQDILSKGRKILEEGRTYETTNRT